MKHKTIFFALMLILVGCNNNCQVDYHKFKSQFLPNVFYSFPDLNITKSSEINVDFLAGYKYIGYCGQMFCI